MASSLGGLSKLLGGGIKTNVSQNSSNSSVSNTYLSIVSALGGGADSNSAPDISNDLGTEQRASSAQQDTPAGANGYTSPVSNVAAYQPLNSGGSSVGIASGIDPIWMVIGGLLAVAAFFLVKGK